MKKLRDHIFIIGLVGFISIFSCAKGSSAEDNKLLIKEYKSTEQIDLAVSHQRVFFTKDTIRQVFTADPGIAEPIVFARNALTLLGKSVGNTTFIVWDRTGHVSVFRLHVEDSPKFSQLEELRPEDAAPRESIFWLSEASEKNTAIAYELFEADSIRNAQHLHDMKKRIEERKKEQVKEISPEITKPPEEVGLIYVPVSEGKIFRTTDKVLKVKSGNISIQEPFIISENEFAVIGKKEGTAILAVYDHSGAKKLFRVQVTGAGLLSKPSDCTGVMQVSPLEKRELKPSKTIKIDASKPLQLGFKHRIVRTSTADPGYVNPVVVSESCIVIVGESAGSTNFFFFDDAGNGQGLELIVTGSNKRCKDIKDKARSQVKDISENIETSTGEFKIPPELNEIVIWSGSKKDVLAVP